MCLFLETKEKSDCHSLYIQFSATFASRCSLPPHAGGGAGLQGSDGQLHTRAPPKPLRVSAIFPNFIPPPPTDRDYDPSTLYDELVIQVKHSASYAVTCIYRLWIICKFRIQDVSLWLCRCHRAGERATWTDCVQRRSGRAVHASQRPPSPFWRPRRTRNCPSSRYCHRRSPQGKWTTGILKSHKFVKYVTIPSHCKLNSFFSFVVLTLLAAMSFFVFKYDRSVK